MSAQFLVKYFRRCLRNLGIKNQLKPGRMRANHIYNSFSTNFLIALLLHSVVGSAGSCSYPNRPSSGLPACLWAAIAGVCNSLGTRLQSTRS